MAEIIGVRFKSVGKVYYFDPDGVPFQSGDRVRRRAAWNAARLQWATAPLEIKRWSSRSRR